ncbi:hypothetical protein SP90_13275 [Halodesulfovibrio spirochaetisodalis]|uniref:Uncharacterized protein n=1 Tax=Halodesulfovibrio spirochaetisodalis TaxID=1560234 RepID=A0A1B7XA53_9BACT|nr:hypothetical protein SP90_13275 [Halodesulfovibrio spirochaetisodalis]
MLHLKALHCYADNETRHLAGFFVFDYKKVKHMCLFRFCIYYQYVELLGVRVVSACHCRMEQFYAKRIDFFVNLRVHRNHSRNDIFE